jgi:hypothetical protein
MDVRKCPKHNTWRRKNKYHPELGAQCEQCRLELDRIQKQNEYTGGTNKPPVVIKRI